eukprot:3638083-Amphidinium_carterae.1
MSRGRFNHGLHQPTNPLIIRGINQEEPIRGTRKGEGGAKCMTAILTVDTRFDKMPPAEGADESNVEDVTPMMFEVG